MALLNRAMITLVHCCPRCSQWLFAGTKLYSVTIIRAIVHSCSLDTLFIDNSPTQRAIKMKFAPLGSPLKSTQMHFKTASFGERIKKLWGCKNYPYIYNGQVVWPQLLWMPIYVEPTWLLSSIMYRAVHIFTNWSN